MPVAAARARAPPRRARAASGRARARRAARRSRRRSRSAGSSTSRSTPRGSRAPPSAGRRSARSPRCAACAHPRVPRFSDHVQDDDGRARTTGDRTDNGSAPERRPAREAASRRIHRGAASGRCDLVAVLDSDRPHCSSTSERVTSAAEGKRLLAADDDTEASADRVQRVVVLTVPCCERSERGADQPRAVGARRVDGILYWLRDPFGHPGGAGDRLPRRPSHRARDRPARRSGARQEADGGVSTCRPGRRPTSPIRRSRCCGSCGGGCSRARSGGTRGRRPCARSTPRSGSTCGRSPSAGRRRTPRGKPLRRVLRRYAGRRVRRRRCAKLIVQPRPSERRTNSFGSPGRQTSRLHDAFQLLIPGA